MDDMLYKAVRYKKEYECVWDEFVSEKSVNGTFLQTRRFLNYHPEGRFIDHSYMVYDEKGNLIAVVPACEELIEGKHVLYSHKGSTFGGLIIGMKKYKVEKVIGIINCVEKQAYEDGIQEIVYKITAGPFSIENSELLEYCLYYRGYEEYKELNLLVDLESCGENLKKNLAQGKRTNVTNCEKQGCYCRVLKEDAEIEQFYNILCKNLQKYNVKPVHALDELHEFRKARLKEEVEFFGIYLNEELIAGAMVFYFDKVKVAHTQYLCALSEFNTLSPMTFLYYSLMVEMKSRGYRKITWGIVTEDWGRYINMGLAKSKEGYGGEYTVNHIFRKEIS